MKETALTLVYWPPEDLSLVPASSSAGGKEAGMCKNTLKASLYLPLLGCRLHTHNSK